MGGRRDQGTPAWCQASSTLPDIPDALALPGLLAVGDGHLLRGGESGRQAHGCVCACAHLWEQQRGHRHKEGSRKQRALLWIGYLSLQTTSLLPALDTVLANMCDCWKCNDDYLHI